MIYRYQTDIYVQKLQQAIYHFYELEESEDQDLSTIMEVLAKPPLKVTEAWTKWYGLLIFRKLFKEPTKHEVDYSMLKRLLVKSTPKNHSIVRTNTRGLLDDLYCSIHDEAPEQTLGTIEYSGTSYQYIIKMLEQEINRARGSLSPVEIDTNIDAIAKYLVY